MNENPKSQPEIHDMEEYKVAVHQHDLPENFECTDWIAIDTETLGLNQNRDRLCLVQVYAGGDTVHCIQIAQSATKAPRLCKILKDPKITKIFHFARFDVGILYKTYGLLPKNVYCTRIASKFARTNTDSHSLKTLCASLLGIYLAKEESGSYWGAEILSKKQLKYAASDVFYLHGIMCKLQEMLQRETRAELARACMDFLPQVVKMEKQGWDERVFAFHDRGDRY